MTLETEFNLEGAKSAPRLLSGKTSDQINEWFSGIDPKIAANPKLADVLQEAFLKDLKSYGTYADLYSSVATNIEKGKDTPEGAMKILGSAIAGGPSGLAGIVREKKTIYSNLLRLKGPQVHPAFRQFLEIAANLKEADYADAVKPLRLLAAVVKLTNLPMPAAAVRGWAGDSTKSRL